MCKFVVPFKHFLLRSSLRNQRSLALKQAERRYIQERAAHANLSKIDSKVVKSEVNFIGFSLEWTDNFRWC